MNVPIYNMSATVFICLLFCCIRELYAMSGAKPILNELPLETEPLIEAETLVNATLGKSITLRCTIHKVKVYKIFWYFNGVSLALNNVRIRDDKRLSVDNPTANEWTLSIDPVDSSDEGQYSCMLNTGLKKMITLRVGIAPTFLENNGSHQIVVNAIERQNVSLSCDAYGNPEPTIFWYKNNKLITTSSTLVLREVTRHTHSEYECVARNSIQPDPSRHFRINVNFKPSIVLIYHLKPAPGTGGAAVSSKHAKKVKSIHTIEDTTSEGDLQLLCEVTGNPVNSITWLKDDVKIVTPRHRETQSDNTSAPLGAKSISIHTSQTGQYRHVSKLKIKNFDFLDNGIYKCQVNGFEGDNWKSVHINEISNRPAAIESETEYAYHVVTDLRANAAKQSGNLGNGANRNEKNTRTHADDSAAKNRIVIELSGGGVNGGSGQEAADSSSPSKSKNSATRKFNELKFDETLKEHLVESGILMHGRGARSNLTKLGEEASFSELNSKAILRSSPFTVLLCSALIIFCFRSVI